MRHSCIGGNADSLQGEQIGGGSLWETCAETRQECTDTWNTTTPPGYSYPTNTPYYFVNASYTNYGLPNLYLNENRVSVKVAFDVLLTIPAGCSVDFRLYAVGASIGGMARDVDLDSTGWIGGVFTLAGSGSGIMTLTPMFLLSPLSAVTTEPINLAGWACPFTSPNQDSVGWQATFRNWLITIHFTNS